LLAVTMEMLRQKGQQACRCLRPAGHDKIKTPLGEGTMIDEKLIIKVLCVALVAAIMLPAGHLLFPYVSSELSGMQFQAIEAVVSATLGFGISAVLG